MRWSMKRPRGVSTARRAKSFNDAKAEFLKPARLQKKDADDVLIVDADNNWRYMKIPVRNARGTGV